MNFLNHNLIGAIDSAAMIPTLAAMGAMFAFAWWVYIALKTGDLEQGDEWRFDVSRINDLRKKDSTFRLFQPVIQQFARFNRGVFPKSLPEIYREIQAAGLPRSWLPEEYLGKLELTGLLLSPFIFYGCVYAMGINGLILGVVLTLLAMYMLRRNLTNQARERLTAIKRRMPFMLDLMTLLMEAGTTFLHSLEQAVVEYRGHAIAVEFSRVLTDMNLGKTRREAFEAMRDRLNDDEITSIIGSMLQAEQLGTPLAGVFRTQADVLRLKRSQRAEAIAGEAGVKMLLPGVLVMAATVIIIIGPFALNFLIFGFSME
jgi:tight adherence protein C